MKFLAPAVITVFHALFAIPAYASAPEPTLSELYSSDADASQAWHRGWADARVSGDLVFVSGVVVAVDQPQAGAPLERAFEEAFEKISSLLAKAGTDMSQVVDITAYMTDVNGQLEAFDNARLKAMHRPYAASTVVQVTRLIPTDGLAEIKVIARKLPIDARLP